MRVGIPGTVGRKIDEDRFAKWQPFADAVQQRRPDAGTWCEAWTVRDIVVHQAGNAEELARVLRAYLEGEPVGTRGFEEREGPLRLLWGRRPADPARICSRVGPETLGRVRGLLSGY